MALSLTDLAQIMYQVGWTGEGNVAKGLAVAECESGLNVNATNRNPPIEISVGPWQINLLAHKDISERDARDPVKSTRYAYGLSNGGTTYSVHWVRCSRSPVSTRHRRAAQAGRRRTGSPIATGTVAAGPGGQQAAGSGQSGGFFEASGTLNAAGRPGIITAKCADHISGIPGPADISFFLACVVGKAVGVALGSFIILIAIYMLWKDSNARDAAKVLGRGIRQGIRV